MDKEEVAYGQIGISVTEGEIEKGRDRKKKTDKGSPEHSESIVTDGTLETDTEGEIEKARDRKKTDKGSPEHNESIVTDGTLEMGSRPTEWVYRVPVVWRQEGGEADGHRGARREVWGAGPCGTMRA